MALLWLAILMSVALQVHSTIPQEVPIALVQQSNKTGLHYCMTAENLEMKSGKKLQSFVGSCCQYPKLVWTTDGKIFSEDKSICIEMGEEDRTNTNVYFTDNNSLCATFKLNNDGLLQRTFPVDTNPICLTRENDGTYKYHHCNNNKLADVIYKGERCTNVEVLQSNIKASFNFGTDSYCWYTEEFADGNIIKDSKYKFCCDVNTFIFKSDKSMAVRSLATGSEFCLTVDGMPHKSYNELDNKNIKLSSSGCKGTGFVYDEKFKLLKVYGTDRCLTRRSSNQVVIRKCYKSYHYKYKTDQCFALSSSISPGTPLMEATSSLSFLLPQSSSPPLSPSSSLPQSSSTSLSPSSSLSQPSSSLPSPSLSSSFSSSSPSYSSSSIGLFSLKASSNVPTVISITPTLSGSRTSSTSTTTASTITVIPFKLFYNGDAVHGGWGNWTDWSVCSVKCGSGIRERIRYCDNPLPRNGGKSCIGKSKETTACSMPPCSGRSLASVGSNCEGHCKTLGLVCSTSIDTGNTKESFNVKCSLDESAKLWTKDYQPAYNTNNSECSGYVSVPGFVACNITAPGDTRRLCDCIKNDDKGFSPWTPWSECTLACGGGTKSRSRICISNQPSVDECLGQGKETADCNVQKCPIDGGFSEWSSWTTCTKTCDGGTRERNRSCSNPFPENGGSICYGKYIEKEGCAVEFCPVNGGWSDWTEWYHCDKPCNSGRSKRDRWCNNPVPKYGGRMCQGNTTEAVLCNTLKCPNATINVDNIAFDLPWNSSYSDPTGQQFLDFANTVNVNVKRIYEADLDTYHSVLLHNLRKGSVIASFTLYFNALDSFQALFLMDSINVDNYLSKLPIVYNNQTVPNITSPNVPSSGPSNVTAIANGATSINVTWDEIPVLNQNGAITGYIVFHRELTEVDYTSTATLHQRITIQGLKAATQYALRVLAYNNNGNGLSSPRMILSTAEMAPNLPPSTISVLTKSAFSVFIQWSPPPISGRNGIIKGYKVAIKSENGAHTNLVNTNGDDVFTTFDQLIPDTLYIVDVCAFTTAGVGPCIRSFNKTFVSAPSVAPGNATCLNNTSPNSITVTYDPVPLDFIHGILKGYRIEYRAIKVGYKWESSKYSVQFVMVNPFYIKTTIKNLMPNTVYEIQVMAVNEHGIGVKSQVFYGVTCTCPHVIHTNYAQTKPYIYRDAEGNMQGLFKTLLQNITKNVCGLCNGKSSTIDYVRDGKNGWAEKRSLVQVTKEIDEYSEMNFAISGRKEMAVFNGNPYVSLVTHPGMVLFTPKPSTSEQITKMMSSLMHLWPIVVINFVFIMVAGIIFFFLTFDKSSNYERFFFVNGALRGAYWAYITMLTHGYGDITPSTIISRLFAVIWIFIGLVLSAILIGGLTTVLTTASILPDAKLYGTELATIQGSKEYIIGILRNAKVNSKQNYSTTDDVYKALKNRKVQAALIDAFVAASRSDLFSDNEIIARKMLQYSYTYGVVLSGEMENAFTNIANYISNNRQDISHLIESSTPKFSVNYSPKGVTSLFDPSSPFLKTNLVILSGILGALFMLGTIFHFVRQKCKKVTSLPPDWLRESEAVCREFFAKVEHLHNKIAEKFENNIKQYGKRTTSR